MENPLGSLRSQQTQIGKKSSIICVQERRAMTDQSCCAECLNFRKKLIFFLRKLVEDSVHDWRTGGVYLPDRVSEAPFTPWAFTVNCCTRKRWNICWMVLVENWIQKHLLQQRWGLQETFSKRVFQWNQCKFEWLPTLQTMGQLESRVSITGQWATLPHWLAITHLCCPLPIGHAAIWRKIIAQGTIWAIIWCVAHCPDVG